MFAAQAIARDMIAAGRAHVVEQSRRNISTVAPGMADESANTGPEQNQPPDFSDGA